MNNFEEIYSVSGTSALQPSRKTDQKRTAAIIAFPMPQTPEHAAPARCAARGAHAAAPSARRLEAAARRSCERIMDTEVAQGLRYGSAQGVPFGRMKRWQAVAAGGAFTACAFLSLFLGL